MDDLKEFCVVTLMWWEPVNATSPKDAARRIFDKYPDLDWLKVRHARDDHTEFRRDDIEEAQT